MLIVLSPAKSLDYESPLPTRRSTVPQFLDESEELVEVMAAKTPDEIAKLMDISPDLADLNWHRYQEWDRAMPSRSARQAVLAFKGDTYMGLDVAQWSGHDFAYAQNHLRILSGLHGVLRPLDRVNPYRLEMGTKLATERGATLYDYWGNTITDTLSAELEGKRPKVLVNCASKEYFKAVRTDRLDANVITPRFLDLTNGKYQVVGFFAKRARGAMASWLIRNRITTLKTLKDFTGLGYEYDPNRSTRTELAFLRQPQ